MIQTRKTVDELVTKLDLMKKNMSGFATNGQVDAYNYVGKTYDEYVRDLWCAGERGDKLREYVNARQTMNKEVRKWYRR